MALTTKIKCLQVQISNTDLQSQHRRCRQRGHTVHCHSHEFPCKLQTCTGTIKILILIHVTSRYLQCGTDTLFFFFVLGSHLPISRKLLGGFAALLQSPIKWYNEKKSSLDLDLLDGYVDLGHALA